MQSTQDELSSGAGLASHVETHPNPAPAIGTGDGGATHSREGETRSQAQVKSPRNDYLNTEDIAEDAVVGELFGRGTYDELSVFSAELYAEVNGLTEKNTEPEQIQEQIQEQRLHSSTRNNVSSDSQSPSVTQRSTSSRPLQLISSRSLSPGYNSEVALLLLKAIFGFDSFKGEQEASIRASVSGRDVLVVMATGAGKSLCYVFPTIYIQEYNAAKKALSEANFNFDDAVALYKATNSPHLLPLGGCTLVISPLIALMKDQVSSLSDIGIRSVAFNGTVTDRPNVLQKIKNGEFNIVLTSPESAPYVVLNLPPSMHLIAIDEAHCISEWGPQFRRYYQDLGSLRQSLPGVPIVALTATATTRVRTEICRSLEMIDPQTLVTSFDRPNLRYEVAHKSSSVMTDIARVLNAVGEDGSVIVYTTAKKDAERICRDINDLTLTPSSSTSPRTVFSDSLSSSRSSVLRSVHRAEFFHSGRQQADKDRIQDDFMKDRLRIIVSTTAFAMGIDKPNIRAVIHYGMPLSIEDYYQQTGRAGRDGRPSLCVLFWSNSDVQMHHNMKISQPVTDIVRKFCVDTTTCRRRRLLDHFDEQSDEKCQQEKCDVCLPSSSTSIFAAQNHVTASDNIIDEVLLADANDADEPERNPGDEPDGDGENNGEGGGDIAEPSVDSQNQIAADVDNVIARIGSWNMRASSNFGTGLPDCLIEKTACLMFRAKSEAWTVFVLQECPSSLTAATVTRQEYGFVEKLIGQFQKNEYFRNWNFCPAETGEGEVAITAYDTSRWRREDTEAPNAPAEVGKEPNALMLEGRYTRRPSLVFLRSREVSNNDLVLAIVNVHLKAFSSVHDDTTHMEARRLASDVVPWVEKEALGLPTLLGKPDRLAVLVIGDVNLAPPGSYMDGRTHPRDMWDGLLQKGFNVVLPSGDQGRPGDPTNLLLYPASTPRELDNAFFRKPTGVNFEVKASGIVHELPKDELAAWREAQDGADDRLESLVQVLGAPLDRIVPRRVKRVTRLGFLETFSDHKMLSVTLKRLSVTDMCDIPISIGKTEEVGKASLDEQIQRLLELKSIISAANAMTKSLENEHDDIMKYVKATKGEGDWAHFLDGSGTLKSKTTDKDVYSDSPPQQPHVVREMYVTKKPIQRITASIDEPLKRHGVLQFRRDCGEEHAKGDAVEGSSSRRNTPGRKRQRESQE